MTIGDAIHDNMMNLLDEIVEWHADRLQSPKYRENVLNVLATMHNAVCALDGFSTKLNLIESKFGGSCTMEESLEKMEEILDERIEQSELCDDDDDDDE
jgi:hypothetical protein